MFQDDLKARVILTQRQWELEQEPDHLVKVF